MIWHASHHLLQPIAHDTFSMQADELNPSATPSPALANQPTMNPRDTPSIPSPLPANDGQTITSPRPFPTSPLRTIDQGRQMIMLISPAIRGDILISITQPNMITKIHTRPAQAVQAERESAFHKWGCTAILSAPQLISLGVLLHTSTHKNN
jgi:hypothetical protein